MLIEDRSGASESYFSLPADPFTVKDLCHFDFPLYEVAQDYPVKQSKERGYVAYLSDHRHPQLFNMPGNPSKKR
jgi:hypothetical protein